MRHMRKGDNLNQSKRILLECSNTWESDENTGIQRVVRNIIKEAPGVEKDFAVESVPAIVKFDHFRRSGKKSLMSIIKAKCLYFLKKIYHKIMPFFKRFSLPEKVEYFLVSNVRRFMLVVFSILFFPLTIRLFFQPKIIPRRGDVLLLLDSSWMYPIWPVVEKAKYDGAVVGLVVHDIIPLTHPYFFPSAITERFNDWFGQAVGHVDFFIGVSETVQKEVQAYLEQNYPYCQAHGRVGFFHLGCTLDSISKNKSVGNGPKELFKRNNVFIAVGTIEPRKNHKYLLDAFDLVWQECPGASLCIIGKIGWLSDHIVNRIKKHPLFKKNLFMFNDASDTELNYCYRHSRALIFSSFAEGFGLPIVEALGYGLPVFASDIPIHREVGKDFCTYFDINDPACLAKMIIDIEKTGKMPQVRNNNEYKLLTWKDSCRELFTQVHILSRSQTGWMAGGSYKC